MPAYDFTTAGADSSVISTGDVKAINDGTSAPAASFLSATLVTSVNNTFFNVGKDFNDNTTANCTANANHTGR